MQTAFEREKRDNQASGTKLKILAAAEEVMSQKGFAASSISEIARRANVADSAIYLYFKSKQELLFAIPGEKLKEQLALSGEHLEGIPDLLGQLRKLIWLQLRYHDANRVFARLLLLECRSFKSFYSSRTYEFIRQYARIMTSILARGVEAGSFRSDISIKLIRDVIFGALDMEIISSITTGEIATGVSDFDHIVDLVDAMVAPRGTVERRTTRLEAILEAAKRIFAQKEFAGATISEIAGMAGVADATIYEYFHSKEEILLTVAANQLGAYLAQARGAFDIADPVRKLRRLIKYNFSLFLRDRDFLSLFLMSLQVNEKFYSSKAFEMFRSYGALIEGVIEEGKAAGSFRSTVNSRVFRNMFLGSFIHIAMRWFVLCESSRVDKVEEIEQVSELLISAVIVDPAGERVAKGEQSARRKE